MLQDEETEGWTDTLSHYSYYPEAQLRPIMCQLAGLVLKANEKLGDSRAKRVVSTYLLGGQALDAPLVFGLWLEVVSTAVQGFSWIAQEWACGIAHHLAAYAQILVQVDKYSAVFLVILFSEDISLIFTAGCSEAGGPGRRCRQSDQSGAPQW